MNAMCNRRFLRSSRLLMIGLVMAIILFGLMNVLDTWCVPEQSTEPSNQEENNKVIELNLVEEEVNTSPTHVEETFDKIGLTTLEFKPIKAKRPELATEVNEQIGKTEAAQVTEPIEETEPEEETVPQSIERDEEFQDRCRINFAESGNQSLEGQIAVAATILNREQSSSFPDTFYGVINQSGQFSTVTDGEIYAYGYKVYYKNIPDETIEAVERALNGEDPTEQLLWDEAVRLGLDPEIYAAGGALFFYNPYACGEEGRAARECIKVKVRIEDHIFYKVWG